MISHFRLYTIPLAGRLANIEQSLKDSDGTAADIDFAIDSITKSISDAAKSVPTSKYRPHLRPYWNSELTDLKRDKVIKYRSWRKAGSPRDETSTLWINHKRAKKAFSSALRRIARAYENEQVNNDMQSVGMDKSLFWRLLRKARNNGCNKTLAIRNEDEKVVHEIPQVLEVWRTHFSKLCTPKEDENFDENHFKKVSQDVCALNEIKQSGNFLDRPFTVEEVVKAIRRLHLKKACGFDNISSEEILYAGPKLAEILTYIYNLIVDREYIPVNLRRGIQVPLFKGKNLDCLDSNNYRGITLLTNFNKLFEILLWSRLEPWWKDSGMISQLQGACKKGQSCVHTGLLLQETVSEALETNRNIFVSYYDVSKAFDTVWTDGLFWKLDQGGVNGKMWRIMYRSYQNFECRVRIGNVCSKWYTMSCRIHQGGFLSLIKYSVFINGLITQLERSNLCCTINGLKSSPAGYADDLATATTSKGRTDQVNNIVWNYGNTWRFYFNAKKSAVLVYGESVKVNAKNSRDRVFKLGPDRIPERQEYDHVGVKASINPDNESRVLERISRGRKTLNAASGLGIRKKWVKHDHMQCNLLVGNSPHHVFRE